MRFSVYRVRFLLLTELSGARLNIFLYFMVHGRVQPCTSKIATCCQSFLYCSYRIDIVTSKIVVCHWDWKWYSIKEFLPERCAYYFHSWVNGDYQQGNVMRTFCNCSLCRVYVVDESMVINAIDDVMWREGLVVVFERVGSWNLYVWSKICLKSCTIMDLFKFIFNLNLPLPGCCL